MNVLNKILKVIMNTLKAVINPEFMQVGAVSITVPAGAEQTATARVTFSTPFKVIPRVFTEMVTGYGKTCRSLTAINQTYIDIQLINQYATGRSIPVYWVAIDPSQPPLKIGGGDS